MIQAFAANNPRPPVPLEKRSRYAVTRSNPETHAMKRRLIVAITGATGAFGRATALMLASLGLFAAGMAFAYFVVFPSVFGFMVAVAPEGVAWMTDIDKYFSFVLTTFIAFGPCTWKR